MNKKQGAKMTRQSTTRPDWWYVNLRIETKRELQEMVNEQGHDSDIRDVADMVRAIIMTTLFKHRKSRDFAKSVEEAFLDLSPTGRHYDALRGIVTRGLEDYIAELQEEQKKRIKK